MPVPADLAALPKAEVHIHLEGSVRPATLEDFCARTGVTVPRSFTNLNTFVEAFSFAWSAMSSPGDYSRMVREYCEDAIRAGVRYAELELGTIGRSFDCLAEAAEEAARQRDIMVRFVIAVPRNFPIEIAWASLEAAMGVPAVVAIGLGGPEDGYPPEPFAELFREARRRGLRVAPHAGENAGPDSVRDTLDALKPDRIQHGIRAVEDPALVKRLADEGVPLAVCPTSNIRLGVVPSLDEHPLRQLWEAGVIVSVNTDDPGFFACDLLGEYAIAGRLLALDREGYGRLARNAIESSFAPEELKAELLSAIGAWVSKR